MAKHRRVKSDTPVDYGVLFCVIGSAVIAGALIYHLVRRGLTR